MTVVPAPVAPDRAGARGRQLGSLLGLAIFGLALWVLGREVEAVDGRDVARAVRAVPRWQLWMALAATALNYAIITGYDHLALHQLGRRLSAWRISLAGFVAFAIVNNFGFALISGPWARLRVYTRWGIDLAALPQVTAFNALTVWTGLSALLGAVLTVQPPPSLAAWAPLAVWRVGGVVLLGLVALYIGLAAAWRAPLRVWRWTLHMPSVRMAVGQVVLSMLDWVILAAVLWLLMPNHSLPFTTLLTAFLAAQVLGIVSHVPGGLGVFEGTMLALLRGHVAAHTLLASLLLFRIVFYVVPLAVALGLMAAVRLPARRRGDGAGAAAGAADTEAEVVVADP